MIEKKRVGVFETNSSSTHSITISESGDLTDKLLVENGVCEIYPGEFGWDVEEYNDATTKASYCLTWAKEYGSEKHEEMLKEAIKEHTGAETVEFVPAVSEYYQWGYIDHQSSDVCQKAFGSREALKNFIFNHKSWLSTDNDNH